MANTSRQPVEECRKRIRVFLGGEQVADSSHALLVWERPFYPTYYFPAQDVSTAFLVSTGVVDTAADRGEAEVFSVEAGGKVATSAAAWYRSAQLEAIEGHLTFTWGAMDAWFEEDEQVYVHARNPYTRVDILPSSRRVEVLIGDVKVADSTSARFLFETGLPTRYYLPKTDVRMELLEETDHHTACPYKGNASYYSVVIGGTRHENVVWWYPFPLAESTRIAGYVAFYNDRVSILVDGQPETPGAGAQL